MKAKLLNRELILSVVRVSDCPKPPVLDEDADVADERARICKNESTNDILRIQDLSKVKPFAFHKMTNN